MSSSAAAPATLPISTLYIKNLNSKVNKKELRKSLYSYFSAYGQVLDVVALKTKALRGQAWIVYGDHTSAKAALRDAGGKSFFGKPMVIDWAKSVSKAVKAAHGMRPDEQVKAVDPDAPEDDEQQEETPAPHKRAYAEIDDGDDDGEEDEMDEEDVGGQSAPKRARLQT